MNRRLTVICCASLLLYMGWVLAYRAWIAPPLAKISFKGLEQVLARTGGQLDLVRFTLVEPVADPEQAERLRARLGWKGEPPDEEWRALDLQGEQGLPVLNLVWELRGSAAQRWLERHHTLVSALARVGVRAPVQIHLESSAGWQSEALLELVNGALDTVEASQRQPWADGRAASVAGWSNQLPPGPYEVNIQVAARKVADGTRFWVAWPALTSDY